MKLIDPVSYGFLSNIWCTVPDLGVLPPKSVPVDDEPTRPELRLAVSVGKAIYPTSSTNSAPLSLRKNSTNSRICGCWLASAFTYINSGRANGE